MYKIVTKNGDEIYRQTFVEAMSINDISEIEQGGWIRYKHDDPYALKRWNFIPNWTELQSLPEWLSLRNNYCIYLDIDGVLARWYPDGRGYDLEGILDPRNHYFSKVEPIPQMVQLANKLQDLSKQIKDFDVRILSASSQEVIRDKFQWLEENGLFDHFDKLDILFCPLGTNKARFIDRIGFGNSILVDDYNSNLEQFAYSGGTAIKCLNGINSSSGGKFIEIDPSKDSIDKMIATIVSPIVKKINETRYSDADIVNAYRRLAAHDNEAFDSFKSVVYAINNYDLGKYDDIDDLVDVIEESDE